MLRTNHLIKVSIVEDIEEMRTALRDIIDADDGLECISEHETAEDAVRRLPILDPDIVVMDINLNGKNGIEVMRKVKEQNPGMQFLMCTVFQDDESIFESLKAGATGYILKKSSPAEIRESIRSLYHGGSPMTAEIARRVVQSFLSKERNQLESISEREAEILQLISEGLTYKDCADRLFISPATIRNHLHNIYEKLQVKNKTEAVNKYLKG